MQDSGSLLSKTIPVHDPSSDLGHAINNSLAAYGGSWADEVEDTFGKLSLGIGSDDTYVVNY